MLSTFLSKSPLASFYFHQWNIIHTFRGQLTSVGRKCHKITSCKIYHGNIMVCKHFSLYWSFVKGIDRSSFVSPSPMSSNAEFSLQWRHNGRDGVSTHQPHDCLLNPLFRRRSKKTSQLRITGLCARNSPVRWPVNSPHNWPVARKMCPLDDVIIWSLLCNKLVSKLPRPYDAHVSDVTSIFFSKQSAPDSVNFHHNSIIHTIQGKLLAREKGHNIRSCRLPWIFNHSSTGRE